MEREAMKVKLIGINNVNPMAMAKFAANGCYQGNIPEIEPISEEVAAFVRKKLAQTGHHTTMEHQSFSFAIDGIAVSDVTFGLHLAAPFYNSDQRSGRYCSDMFKLLASDDESAQEGIRRYITGLWPETKPESVDRIIDFVKLGARMFADNIEEATEAAIALLRKERPGLNEKKIALLAPKIAQEQLRMVFSTIVPTYLLYSADLVTIISLWLVAWNPALRLVTEKMRQELISEYPALDCLFDRHWQEKVNSDFAPPAEVCDKMTFRPEVNITSRCDDLGHKVPPSAETIDRLVNDSGFDLLPFSPEMMDLNTYSISMVVRLSLATMGQDQRHRTIHRGRPAFTGGFYCPPLLRKIDMHDQVKTVMAGWSELMDELPPSLIAAIAPYGAVLTYRKTATLMALIHESAKRRCFQAQEEIYAMSCSLFDHFQIPRILGGEAEYAPQWRDICHQLSSPSCIRCGRCGEGDRFCGRKLESDDQYPDRQV